MAIEIINVGTSPNDGNGDALRNAFIKCNDNFDELETTKIGGSGADNYVPKFNGTDAVENSQIFDNGSGVGIGTISPIFTASGRGNLTINGSTDSILVFGKGGAYSGYLYSDSSKVELSSNTQPITISTNGNEKMRITSAGNVGIGLTNPSSSAILHLKSNSKGFLPPTMTTSERNSIGGPENGLVIYNTDSETIDVFTTGGGWKSLSY